MFNSFVEITYKLTKSALALSFVALMSISISANADSSSDDTSSPSIESQIKAANKLIYKEQYKKALKKLNATLKQDKENANVWNLIGYASRKSGDTDAAGEAYKKALTFNKDHLGALEYQGELFITLGDIANAESNLQRLAELCPEGCEEREDLEEAIAAAK